MIRRLTLTLLTLMLTASPALARESLNVAEKVEKRLDQPSEGFVRVIAGTFLMGSPLNEKGRNDDETQHRVTLTKDFYLMKHEVTQAEYHALMGKNPSSSPRCGANCPVDMVSWKDAITYANKLSEKEGLSRCYDWPDGTWASIRFLKPCNGYRLPTEAEWEYAARAGTTTAYAGASSINAVAWYRANSDSKPHPVGQKKANAWGLYDMLGNVDEWTWDWYGPYSSNATDPTGPRSGNQRVTRGGTWLNGDWQVRVAHRSYSEGLYDNRIGFRLARTVQ